MAEQPLDNSTEEKKQPNIEVGNISIGGNVGGNIIVGHGDIIGRVPRQQEVKWWRTVIITSAVALLATILIFVVVWKTTDCAITNQNWLPYDNDGLGSTITVRPDAESNCALQISFNLKKKRAYVAAYKKLEPKFLAWWIRGIQFTY